MKKKPFGYATGSYFFMKFYRKSMGIVCPREYRYPLSVIHVHIEIRSWTLDIRPPIVIGANLKQLSALKAIGQV